MFVIPRTLVPHPALLQWEPPWYQETSPSQWTTRKGRHREGIQPAQGHTAIISRNKSPH